MANLRLLHLEDDQLDAKAMRLCLSQSSRTYRLDQVSSLAEGARCYQQQSYDVILLDLSLPDCFGSQALKQARECFAELPIIVVTGNSDQEQAERFVDVGADDYLFKSELSSAAIWKSIVYAIRKKQLEKKLQQQTTDLKVATELEKRANRSKTEFLANVSHDLRTPLGVVLGYSELLETQTPLSDEAREYVQRIRKTTSRLVELVNDLLDLSKVETGHFEVNQSQASLLEELKEALDNHGFRAREKGITFQATYETPMPEIVVMDRLRTRQILDNLIGNAIKFTGSGMVNVRIAAKTMPLLAILTFEVEDSGPGISDDVKDKIFEPFQQAHSGISATFGGTGLGLALSRKLAKTLGGRIELLSTKVGRGSCFRFTLPVELPLDNQQIGAEGCHEEDSVMATKEPAAVAAGPIKRKILLAEDNPDNQLLFRHFLVNAGYEVDTVSNGREAVDKAIDQPYEVILMDMQMPVMAGGDAVTELRHRGYNGLIIALTAYAMPEEKANCLNLGCDDFLSKPVTRNDLENKIEQYAGVIQKRRRAQGKPAPASAELAANHRSEQPSSG